MILPGTFRAVLEYGKTYLLRFVNAAMNEIHFLGIADHPVTVVGVDGSYTKPFTNDYIVIGPGQTVDALITANQNRSQSYYLAAKAYQANPTIGFDNTTTTAILQYTNETSNGTTPQFPVLPLFNDTRAVLYFTNILRSLGSPDYPISVPDEISANITTTISINYLPCEANNTCAGPNGTRLAAAMNNVSFVVPRIDILEAYFYQIEGIYTTDFPLFPPFVFNYTYESIPMEWLFTERATRVIVLPFNSTVEMVIQNVGVVLDHPMHIHGFSFYVVGTGVGNYNSVRDPLTFNLVDPPFRNTAIVPIAGWSVIRFRANNPGKKLRTIVYIHIHHHSW